MAKKKSAAPANVTELLENAKGIREAWRQVVDVIFHDNLPDRPQQRAAFLELRDVTATLLHRMQCILEEKE